MNTIFKGKRGEKIACNYLYTQGYLILEKNKKICGVEIDIIARKEDTICLIEVKTRSSDFYGTPEQSVSKKQKMHMIRAAKILSNQELYRNCDFRFDVIAIIDNREQTTITHFPDAFYFEY
jgi:putative endonuclease